jgi:hypothetical protein
MALTGNSGGAKVGSTGGTHSNGSAEVLLSLLHAGILQPIQKPGFFEKPGF